MSLFVHLAVQNAGSSIRRSGITRLRRQPGRPHGIFAMPVVPSFFMTHQWLRELRRRNAGPLLGIYFRIPDGEPVWFGHYRGLYQLVAAARAEALGREATIGLGREVIVPRSITRQELHKVRVLPQVLGWRYFPGAHGKPPCGCDSCQRGQFGVRKRRTARQ